MTNELIVVIIFNTITIIFMALGLLFPKLIADYGNKLLSNKEKIMNKARSIISVLAGYAFPILTIGYLVAFKPLDKLFVVTITLCIIVLQLTMQVQTKKDNAELWK